MRAIARAAPVLERELRNTSPTESGELRERTTVRARGLSAEVAVAVSYASYVSEGTQPHPIVGNPILAFYWSRIGRTAFFRRVSHPGTRPQDWYRTATGRWTSMLEDSVD